MDKRAREEHLTFLQKIKPFLVRNHYVAAPENLSKAVSTEESQKTSIVDPLLRRIEKLERALVAGGQLQDEGMRKGKTKDKFIEMLQKHKKLTASDMGELLGLSRSRCSEYFRELMLEGKVEGVQVDKQKFYKLVK